jgi:hypothetical protein
VCEPKLDCKDPYITVVLFASITSDGITAPWVEVYSIHKYYDSSMDTYHVLSRYPKLCSYDYDGTYLKEVYAKDYSFYFAEKDLILIPKGDVLG